jgi:amino acid transporter
MALLVMDPALTAALAIGIASYVGYLIDLSSFGRTLAIAIILSLAAINLCGIRSSALLVRCLTILKLSILLLLSFFALSLRLGDWSNFAPLRDTPLHLRCCRLWQARSSRPSSLLAGGGMSPNWRVKCVGQRKLCRERCLME